MSVSKLYMMSVKVGNNNFIYLLQIYRDWLEKNHTHTLQLGCFFMQNTYILARELKLC